MKMTSNGNELSERELEILRLLATGASNKEIAQKLYISANTVKVHLRNIYSKIEVNTRTEAAMYAVNIGIIERYQLADSSLDPASGGDDETAISSLADTASQAGLAGFAHKYGTALWLGAILTLGLLVIVLVVVLQGNKKQSSALESPPSETENPNATQQLWNIKADLPTPRAQFAAVSYKDKLITLAGMSQAGATGVVEQYDIQSNQWTTLAGKPVKVSGIQGVVIDDRVFIPGGYLSDGSLTDILEIYDVSENSWSRGAGLPIPISDYGLAAVDGKLFLLGGWDGKKVLDTVYEYDPDTDRWSPQTPMQAARSQFGAVSVNGKIYVFGGFDGKKALDATEVFTPGQDGSPGIWASGAAMPEGDYGMGATSLLDIVYIVGGVNHSTKTFPILVYYTDTEEWQSIELPQGFHLGAGMGVASQGQYLYIMGGKQGETILGEFYAYRALLTTSLPLIIK